MELCEGILLALIAILNILMLVLVFENLKKENEK